MATVPFNPVITTNALGSFSVFSDGFIQGVAVDDPNERYGLAGGVLAVTETLPMWQGVGIGEYIPTDNKAVLGPTIRRATAQANLSGFSVINQAYSGITSPQSPVPLFGSSQTINFYRFGSGQKVCLAIDPALISLDGGLTTQQVSWDFTNQRIVAFDGVAALPVKVLQVSGVNCKTVVYNAGTGFATFNNNGACALVFI